MADLIEDADLQMKHLLKYCGVFRQCGMDDIQKPQGT
jgi:hypothetical protein